eukprot:6722518-Pyramimonas_sp.AAC.1
MQPPKRPPAPPVPAGAVSKVRVAALSPAPQGPPNLRSEPKEERRERPPDERETQPGTASADQLAAKVSTSEVRAKSRPKVRVHSPAETAPA